MTERLPAVLDRPPPAGVLDVAVGMAATAAGGVVGGVMGLGRRSLHLAVAPAVLAVRVPQALLGAPPARWTTVLAARGRSRRATLRARANELVDLVVPPLLGTVLDRIDLTALVAERVDIDALVATVDIDAIVARIDLVGLTEHVIDEIDLTEIIRESTGSVATEGVRDVRMHGIAADEAVSRALGRLRPRLRHHSAPDGAP
jgi:hypothetical protein